MSGVADYLGKGIDEICGNGFDNPSLNHCAHFVSHAQGFRFAYNCKQATGGGGAAANLRVHEIFAKCAQVGTWPAPSGTQPALIFVTARKNVDLAQKTMANVPRKHIGIYESGFVYHYSNTRDEVVRQTVSEFQKTFDKTYGGPQGYFWGVFAQGQPAPQAAVAGVVAAQESLISFARKDVGEDIFAVTGSEQFYVGTPTSQFRGGLFQRAKLIAGTPSYKAADHKAMLGQWAELLELTGHCESRNKLACINTYDRAAFTFGFYQLAAHTPNDNLILLLRRLPSLKSAQTYAPQLQIKTGGKLVWKKPDGSELDLEATGKIGGETSNVVLMRFLNPNQPAIDDAEFDWAARLIHWTLNDPAMRQLQVDVSGAILRSKVSARYDTWYDLDGASDVVVAVIADIHHNGRATKTAVKAALAKPKPADRLNALIDINPNHEPRQKMLRAKLDAMVGAGRLGRHKWVRAVQDFVDPDAKPEV